MKDWKPDNEWANQPCHLAEIERVLLLCAQHIMSIRQADAQEDQKQATDYVIEVTGGLVACRIRRAKSCPWRDLTIRQKRPSGAQTEYQKIKAGWADWYLYAWANEAGTFMDWIVVDLECFRASLIDKPCGQQSNRDGSSDFYYWPLVGLQSAGCVVASLIH